MKLLTQCQFCTHWLPGIRFIYLHLSLYEFRLISAGSFLDGCEELKSQRDLLTAVQKLLDIPPTPYPELDQTEQDLSYLRALYGNYQHFIDFDKRSVSLSQCQINTGSMGPGRHISPVKYLTHSQNCLVLLLRSNTVCIPSNLSAP